VRLPHHLGERRRIAGGERDADRFDPGDLTDDMTRAAKQHRFKRALRRVERRPVKIARCSACW
jgi:hypothetical protein